jgi:ABC-type bacteriocin/lantibiotic exporter with double-glycine peptidase domain
MFNNSFLDVLQKFKSRLGKRLYFVLSMASILTILESVGFTLFYPLITKTVDTAYQGNTGKDNFLLDYFDNWDVTGILMAIALVFCIKGLVHFFIDYQINTSKAVLGDKLRHELILRVSEKSYYAFKSLDPYKYSNFMNDQVNQSSLSFQYFCQFFGHLSAVLFYSLFAMNFSILSFVVAIILGLVVYVIFHRLNQQVKILSTTNSFESLNLTYKGLEVFTSVQYLHATKFFNKAKLDLRNISKNLFDINKQLGRANAATKSIREPFAVLIVTMIIYITTEIYDGKVLSALVSILFIYKISTSMFGIQGNWQNTISHIGSLDRINDEIDEVISYENFTKIEFSKIYESLRGKQSSVISYSLTGSDAKVVIPLNELTFSKGKINLITGRSGVGKSTFFDTLCGIHSFKFIICEAPNVGLDVLYRFDWSTIGYMTQNNLLVGGSLMDNVTYPLVCGDLSVGGRKKAENILLELNLGQSIDELYEDTRINIEGSGLSGGQKQRLFFAREIYREPELLVLDEPTSAQDSVNEKAILSVLKKYCNNSIIFIASHDKNINAIADYTYTIK